MVRYAQMVRRLVSAGYGIESACIAVSRAYGLTPTEASALAELVTGKPHRMAG